MKPYYSEANLDLYHGDCLDVLAKLPANSVDTVITDPPYELGFMGKAWDSTGVAFRPETWAAVLRVAKPGAMLLAFGGTRTFHRLTCAIEDAGWEIRDCMSYLYGSGFPKSLDISKAIDKAAGAENIVGTKPDRWTGKGNALNFSTDRPQTECKITAPATEAAKTWDGWGTALKPAWEPIVLAMKPLDGTFAENAQAHGVAGLNIDGGRIGTDSTVRNQNAGPTWSGEYKGGERLNGSTSGRWPANVLLDEAAAAQLDLLTGELSSGVMRAGTRRAAQDQPGSVCYGTFGGNATSADTHGDSGGASRFFYTSKASRSDRGAGNVHPTVKPTELLKYLCRLTATPTGGVVLDPFVGSGTTLVAARDVGRRSIGIELEESHCRIVIDRLRQGVLFAAEASA